MSAESEPKSERPVTSIEVKAAIRNYVITNASLNRKVMRFFLIKDNQPRRVWYEVSSEFPTLSEDQRRRAGQIGYLVEIAEGEEPLPGQRDLYAINLGSPLIESVIEEPPTQSAEIRKLKNGISPRIRPHL